ncbi:unnamed protein product [Tilletia laevis]|uniref:Uncharacterized protein n=3 Tax=Tilletia TaxID=13289 RepID=A0A8X7MNC6_9BASI|nr:hypothetical protein CF328_g9382 [Tilletia controversa]KAE8181730.1 hypothetical protein CF335_g8834 [Tilletia laevis]KAE8236583.1 hypothetical protein A4X03_0g9390 [Tilletia caries]KAE8192685.1 hypothetical protein CF336_g4322 [Tilletia laevis]KAE8242894.1 hypothetical protein A4X06_0g6697 [Tilletia controversa]
MEQIAATTAAIRASLQRLFDNFNTYAERARLEHASSAAPTIKENELLLAHVFEESVRTQKEDNARREQKEQWEATLLEYGWLTDELFEQQRILEALDASTRKQPRGGRPSQASEASDGAGDPGTIVKRGGTSHPEKEQQQQLKDLPGVDPRSPDSGCKNYG